MKSIARTSPQQRSRMPAREPRGQRPGVLLGGNHLLVGCQVSVFEATRFELVGRPKTQSFFQIFGKRRQEAQASKRAGRGNRAWDPCFATPTPRRLRLVERHQIAARYVGDPPLRKRVILYPLVSIRHAEQCRQIFGMIMLLCFPAPPNFAIALIAENVTRELHGLTAGIPLFDAVVVTAKTRSCWALGTSRQAPRRGFVCQDVSWKSEPRILRSFTRSNSRKKNNNCASFFQGT